MSETNIYNLEYETRVALIDSKNPENILYAQAIVCIDFKEPIPEFLDVDNDSELVKYEFIKQVSQVFDNNVDTIVNLDYRITEDSFVCNALEVLRRSTRDLDIFGLKRLVIKIPFTRIKLTAEIHDKTPQYQTVDLYYQTRQCDVINDNINDTDNTDNTSSYIGLSIFLDMDKFGKDPVDNSLAKISAYISGQRLIIKDVTTAVKDRDISKLAVQTFHSTMDEIEEEYSSATGLYLGAIGYSLWKSYSYLFRRYSWSNGSNMSIRDCRTYRKQYKVLWLGSIGLSTIVGCLATSWVSNLVFNTTIKLISSKIITMFMFGPVPTIINTVGALILQSVIKFL